MIRVVGEFGYDSNGCVYQWRDGSLFQSKGWVIVCNKPLPMTVAGEAQTKRILRY
ncbi:MAG: hypothetical protein Q8Q30_01695 [Candidatus Woesebacteria bacterium]|nr:hypothetical protein [Candidatus Woesebacteria bacterium]